MDIERIKDLLVEMQTIFQGNNVWNLYNQFLSTRQNILLIY
jgi:hypothetical protein